MNNTAVFHLAKPVGTIGPVIFAIDSHDNSIYENIRYRTTARLTHRVRELENKG